VKQRLELRADDDDLPPDVRVRLVERLAQLLAEDLAAFPVVADKLPQKAGPSVQPRMRRISASDSRRLRAAGRKVKAG
jgi:hypothetical protein